MCRFDPCYPHHTKKRLPPLFLLQINCNLSVCYTTPRLNLKFIVCGPSRTPVPTIIECVLPYCRTIYNRLACRDRRPRRSAKQTIKIDETSTICNFKQFYKSKFETKPPSVLERSQISCRRRIWSDFVVAGATIGRPPKNGLKSMSAGRRERRI